MTDKKSEIITTKTSTDKNGYNITEILNVRQHWSTWSTSTKILVSIYGISAISYYFFGIYNDGKSSLLAFRQAQFNKTLSQSNFKNEFEAVKHGCSLHAWSRFWSSLIIPYTCISEIMPSIILFFNPK